MLWVCLGLSSTKSSRTSAPGSSRNRGELVWKLPAPTPSNGSCSTIRQPIRQRSTRPAPPSNTSDSVAHLRRRDGGEPDHAHRRHQQSDDRCPPAPAPRHEDARERDQHQRQQPRAGEAEEDPADAQRRRRKRRRSHRRGARRCYRDADRDRERRHQNGRQLVGLAHRAGQPSLLGRLRDHEAERRRQQRAGDEGPRQPRHVALLPQCGEDDREQQEVESEPRCRRQRLACVGRPQRADPGPGERTRRAGRAAPGCSEKKSARMSERVAIARQPRKRQHQPDHLRNAEGRAARYHVHERHAA